MSRKCFDLYNAVCHNAGSFYRNLSDVILLVHTDNVHYGIRDTPGQLHMWNHSVLHASWSSWTSSPLVHWSQNAWCHPNQILNSLAPGKFELNFRYLILQIISVIDGWRISCELALRWMSLDLTDDKSKLVQVMAWCHQATSHYLS